MGAALLCTACSDITLSRAKTLRTKDEKSENQMSGKPKTSEAKGRKSSALQIATMIQSLVGCFQK